MHIATANQIKKLNWLMLEEFRPLLPASGTTPFQTYPVSPLTAQYKAGRTADDDQIAMRVGSTEEESDAYEADASTDG